MSRFDTDIVERLRWDQRYTRGHVPVTLADAAKEIERLREQLSHGMPAIEELTKEREEYRMRWLGSMTPEDAALIRDENERLRALVMLGDFSSLRPNSDSFKLVQQIRREQSAVEQSGDAK